MTFVSTIAALGMMPFWIYTLGPYVSEDDLVIISQQSRAHVVASLVCWRGSVAGSPGMLLIATDTLPRKKARDATTFEI